MARISLNVDQEAIDNAGAAFAPVPVGRYKVSVYEINEAEVKTGPNEGKLRLRFQFKIADGEPQANRRLFADVNAFETVKDGKTHLPYELINIASALGVSADDLADTDTDEWLGQELYVTVAHEEKKTKESNYKESFNPKEYRERLKAYRSVDSVETSATASATVKANSGAKATAAGGKKTYTL